MEIVKVEDKCWTPVRVKPRQEKKLYEYCKAKKITAYLPVIKRVHRYERRTAEFFVPMFPGYVFCCVDEDSYRDVLMSNTVVYRIQVDEHEELSLIDELAAVQSFEKVSHQGEVVIKPELVEGVKVTVSSGPLQGVTGIVVRRKGETTITVNVEILGQSATAHIDIGDLEADE